ncbi:membrane protein [Mycobacterium sp. SWH-M1]|nr:membrane protein [Mycobacterium sp. SWH-M1]
MDARDRTVRSRSAWRGGVPVVCAAAGLLLGATYSVSGGDEIRRSDAPRLVDLVRETQQSVDRLTAERDALSPQIENHHGGSPSAAAALTAISGRADALAPDGGLTPMRGPGLVVTLNDAQRDAQGRFPRDASPDDLVVHQQDIQAVLNALWSAGAEGIQMQDQRLIATSAPRCVGNTLLLNGRTYSPPYVVTAVGDAAALQRALSEAPLVTLYKQYAVRFGLGYQEEAREVELVGYTAPITMKYAQPIGPLGY